MTLLETERLARKLAAAVNQSPDPATSLRLAEDFSAACRSANIRLRQCEAMLDSGDISQALQLAEATPNLLDLITRLEFRESDAWRAYCHANRIPAAEPLDDRAVSRLNEAYAAGITNQDPLYKRYRKAVLTKNDNEARAILRSITRLNPSDSNATSELARLDSKVLAATLAVLAGAVETATPAQVGALSEAIESAGFTTPPGGEQWRRAQRVRVIHLLDQAELAKATGDWRTALSHLELIQFLQGECEFDLSVADKDRFATLKQWADAGLKRNLQNQEFSKQISELTRLLAVNEEKDTMARAVPTAEMKADYEGLHRVWRALQDLAGPVPEELSSRFRKRSSLLTAEISRRMRRRVQAIVAASAALLLLGGLITWFALAQFRARDFARQLASAEEARHFRTAEKLVKYIKTEQASLLGVGALNAALAKADSFINRETENLKAFQGSFALLPESPQIGLSAERLTATQKQLEQAKLLFEKMAEDLRGEFRPRLASFENKWNEVLVQETTNLNKDYEARLRKIEEGGSKLNYRSGPEETRKQVGELVPLAEQLRQAEQVFGTNVAVRSDLRQRRELADSRITAFQSEMQKYDDAVGTLRRAKVFAEFAAAVQKLSQSEFTGSPDVVVAKSYDILSLSDEALLQAVLTSGGFSLATYLKEQGMDRFFPSAAMPAEVKLAQEIQSAQIIGATVRRYRLVLKTPEHRTLEWYTLGAMIRQPRWSTISAYDPAASPSAFTTVEAEYGYFDGVYRLSEERTLESLQDLGAVQETFCASSLALESPRVGSSWSRPLLGVLDEVNQAKNCSPLFRAFVFSKLVEIMELQPEVWGLAFSPTARAHRDRIREITGGIKNGDWFAPIPSSRLSRPLEDFFAANRQASYLKQAQGLASLARKTWEFGVKMVGYIDAQGQAHLQGGTSPTELWGFDRNKSPALLFRNNQGKLAVARPALPLSPLFALQKPKKDLLTLANINPQDKLFNGHLPPLFAEFATRN